MATNQTEHRTHSRETPPVYVLDHDGTPLMPTRRHGRVRRMLKSGEAVIEQYTPFTIRLTTEQKRYTQPVDLGIDPGYGHVGISATANGREQYAAEDVLKEDTSKNLEKRRGWRRNRRTKKVRHRKPRFDNRKRPAGWLPPSVQGRYDGNIAAIDRAMSILPITSIKIEIGEKAFDTKGKETRAPGESLRDYLYRRQNGRCAVCGEPLDSFEVHHVGHRAHGGTDTLANLVAVCKDCHHAVHAGDPVAVSALPAGHDGYKPGTFMNVLNGSIVADVEARHPGVPVSAVSPVWVAMVREAAGLPKDHCVDALIIGGHAGVTRLSSRFLFSKVRRHNRTYARLMSRRGGKNIAFWQRRCVVSGRAVKGFCLWDVVRVDGGVLGVVLGRRSSGYFRVMDLVSGEVLGRGSVSSRRLSLVRHQGGYHVDVVGVEA